MILIQILFSEALRPSLTFFFLQVGLVLPNGHLSCRIVDIEFPGGLSDADLVEEDCLDQRTFFLR